MSEIEKLDHLFDVRELICNDYIVMFVGANDIFKNETSKATKELKNCLGHLDKCPLNDNTTPT